MTRRLRDIRTLFDTHNEDCYEPVRVNNAFDDNFVKYESKTLSIEGYQ